MNIEQIIHCLEEVVRYSDMLARGDTSRPRDLMIAQLAFNWGRYWELAQPDEHHDRNIMQKCILEGKYMELKERTTLLLEDWKCCQQ